MFKATMRPDPRREEAPAQKLREERGLPAAAPSPLGVRAARSQPRKRPEPRPAAKQKSRPEKTPAVKKTKPREESANPEASADRREGSCGTRAVVRCAAAAGWAYCIDTGSTMIGRAAKCSGGGSATGADCAPPSGVVDTTMSRQHAQIRRGDDGAFQLTCLSANHVLVDGKPLKAGEPPLELSHGNQLTIGRCELTFEVEVAEPLAEPEEEEEYSARPAVAGRGYTRVRCYYSLKFLVTIGILHTNENKGDRMTKYPRLSRVSAAAAQAGAGLVRRPAVDRPGDDGAQVLSVAPHTAPTASTC
jgi:hypothetical protein